ncbi:MAG: anhydro-N-acetylmuramic acid kinase [Acidobacteria bacterium]|nr:anhydro-N-acetylmuramic acid kinase [Acidobacteriota bacterium]
MRLSVALNPSATWRLGLAEEFARSRLAVGLMSGTSLDAVDAALVRLAGSSDKPRVRLVAFTSVRYSLGVRKRILHVASGEAIPAREISQLNFLLGELFAEAALRVCRKARISPHRLSVIGSHGQTVFHQGFATLEAGRKISSTLQIAEPAVIAERIRAPVVANFRTRDIASGGQGAPLVPLVDYLLFKDRSKGTVTLNLGGIANVTVIPAGAGPEEVLGFDTGPGNMVMDALARRFTHGRKDYDSGGRLAAQGKVLEERLSDALRFPFFREAPPKSAGREQFGDEFIKRYFFSGRKRESAQDLLRTANELTARTVAEALRNFVWPRASIGRLIVSGGGAHNRLLLKKISELMPELDVDLSDAFGIPVDAKEAIAFAILADRTLQGLPGNLPAVTGARRAAVLGSIHPR